MKYFFLLSLLFLLIGNCNEPSQKEGKKDQVIIEAKKILKEWNIEANISKEELPNNLKLLIEIIKPTITHKDHSSIIASCLVVKHLNLPKNKSITLNISSQIDNVKTPLSEVTYSQENIKGLNTMFADVPLLSMNEYCIKNFDPTTTEDLEKLMTKNHELEKWSTEGSFYQLIYNFFKESKGYKKDKNATMTMFFLYLTTSDFLQGTELEHHSRHLKSLWKMVRNEDIQDFEKQFNEILNKVD